MLECVETMTQVIGMNKENSINRFMKKDSVKHYPATGDATLSGVIVEM